MSRHRNVRSMNYQDEYDGYDDVYGHSVEDGDFCVSPSTAHYLSDRSNQPSLLEAFMTPSKINEEVEGSDEEQNDPLQESAEFQRPQLGELDEARLNSCLEQMRNILGDSTPEHLMVNAVIKNDFSFEKALSFILNQQEAPKPQRERRSRTRDPESGSLSPCSSSPSPATSPSYSLPLSNVKSHIQLKGTAPTGQFNGGLLGLSELCLENNQNVGNVIKRISDHCPLLKSIGVKNESDYSQHVFSHVQASDRPSQPVPGNISLGSLAETYSQSPSLETGMLVADSIPRTPPGLSLSMLAQQQQNEQQSKKQQKDTIKMDFTSQAPADLQVLPAASTQQLSLADLAREQSHQPTCSGSSLNPQGLSSLANAFLQTEDIVTTPSLFSCQSQKDTSAPRTAPRSCPGLSLASLAQQQQGNNPIFQGRSSPSELAQQHIGNDGKTGEALVSHSAIPTPIGRAALGEKVTAVHKQTLVPESFSMASLISQQTDSEASTPTGTLWQHSSQNVPGSNKAGVGVDAGTGPGFSLAALAQIHAFTEALPTDVLGGHTQGITPALHGRADTVDDQETLGGFSLTDFARCQIGVGPPQKPTLDLPCLTETTTPPGFSSLAAVTSGAQTKPLQVPPGFGKVDLAALARRHQDSYHKLSPDSDRNNITSVSASLSVKQPHRVVIAHFAHPSMFGHVMCSTSRYHRAPCSRHMHPKFAYRQQTSHNETNSSHVLQDIVPFDFTTPSPDDMVKARQRGAFTRTGERTEYCPIVGNITKK